MPRIQDVLARPAVRVLAVAAVAAAVAVMDVLLFPRVDTAFFYFLPIILSCAWFGVRGFLLIPVVLAVHHWNTVSRLAAGQPYPYGNDAVKLLSFLLIGWLALLAQRRLQMLQEARQEQVLLRRAAEARGVRLESLYRVASAANASRGADEFLTLFLDEVRHMLPPTCIASVWEQQDDVLVRRVATGPDAAQAIGERLPVGTGIAGQVAQTRRPLLLNRTEWSVQEIASEWVRRARPSAAMVVPLVAAEEVIGVVSVFGGPGAVFTEEDLRTLESMASEAALVLASLRLYEDLRSTNAALQERQSRLDQQLALAREVQRAMLSVCPGRCAIGPLEFASCHQPAWEVGGDILRIVPHEEGTAVLIGDVMGKGVPAALLMTMMTAQLSSPAAPAGDPAAVLTEANRVLIENIAASDTASFVTVCYAYIATESRQMAYASAGHPPTVLVPAGGAPELLMAQGLPLGISRDAEYPMIRRNLQPGDRLVLYTDGVTEARNAAGELYGAGRLRDVAARHRALSATELRDAIAADLQAFMGERAPADDIALVVVGV